MGFETGRLLQTHTLRTGLMAPSQTSLSHCWRLCLVDRSNPPSLEPLPTMRRVILHAWLKKLLLPSSACLCVCVHVWQGNTLLDITCGTPSISTDSKNKMNRNGCFLRVLIQGITQNTHVSLQVVPEKTCHISGSGVDHVTNTLQQIRPPRDYDLQSSVQRLCKRLTLWFLMDPWSIARCVSSRRMQDWAQVICLSGASDLCSASPSMWPVRVWSLPLERRKTNLTEPISATSNLSKLWFLTRYFTSGLWHEKSPGQEYDSSHQLDFCSLDILIQRLVFHTIENTETGLFVYLFYFFLHSLLNWNIHITC